MTETLILQKVAHNALSGRMVFVSVFSCEKNEVRVEKKWEKFRKLFHNFFSQKIKGEKILTSFLA